MNQAELENYIDKAIAVIKDTLYALEPELLENFGTIEHEKKIDKSAVTRLDKHVETVLKTQLSKLTTSVGFVGEEFGAEGNADLYWLIDPIDGTEAFIRGMPFCSNMLCLVSDNQPIASVIYNFPLNKMYIAIKGKGAFCNDTPIKVSDRDISHASTIFYINKNDARSRELYFKIPRYSQIRLVSAGYEFCLIASGAIEARVQYGSRINKWDYLPGVLLVQEAGGIVANIGVNTFNSDNMDFIASNRAVYQKMQDFFKKETPQ